MGSSGSGSFSDYPGSAKPGAEDRCNKAFKDNLQDIEHCDYFKKHGTCPPVGMEVQVGHDKRVLVQTSKGETIGNLPTARNYLVGCMKEGFTYVGKITVAKDGPPSAIIAVDIAAVPPK